MNTRSSWPRFFWPRLFDTLLGYDRATLARDVGAGLTVGVVALPLAMAFAIASGLKPEAGLITAVVAGFLISCLGGSRVQIGGPAGAFIVIVYGIVERYGPAQLLLATAMSGLMLFLMGVFRLGTLIRFIPVAVVIGFTNGIAVLIGLSQIKDFLGLQVSAMPADFVGMVRVLSAQMHTLHLPTLGVALASLSVLVLWSRCSAALATRLQGSAWAALAGVPGSVVALLLVTAACGLLALPVQTIGSKFGGMAAQWSQLWPAWQLPPLQWELLHALFMPALTLALLGAIESLLCARIADGLSGDRHHPNQELMAQGIANLAVPFWAGMPATGTIARTVTNIKSGARTPVAGMVHALTLLALVMVAAPVAQHIPLACLAAILMHVAWNMGQWREFLHLRQYRLPYRLTLLAVFGLTVVVDLTVAVEVGLVAAGLTFIYRISSLSRSEALSHAEQPLLYGHEGQIRAWRLYGALFFGAVKLVEDIENQLDKPVVVLDLKNLIYIDSSGADALLNLVHTCRKKQVLLIVCGLSHQPQDIAQRSGLLALLAERLQADLASGLAFAQAQLAAPAETDLVAPAPGHAQREG